MTEIIQLLRDCDYGAKMLGTLDEKKSVTIFGAGIAGLTLAYRLKQLNVPFTLIEKNKIGGKIQTFLSDFGPVESAASALYLNRATVEFLRELNLSPLMGTKNLKRRIWKEHEHVSPFSLSLVTGVALRLHKRPPLSFSASVEDVFLPLLGQKNIDEVLSPALQGIYGAEARDLHFHGVFSFAEGKSFPSYFSFLRALKTEIKKGQHPEMKGTAGLAGGMHTLIERLRSEVGEHIRYGEWEPAPEGNLAICTNALEAAELLKDFAPAISEELRRIRYVPVSSFTIFTKNPVPELSGVFGSLVPQNSGLSVLGIINQSEIFPANYPRAHSYRVILKGEHREKEILLQELQKVLPKLPEAGVLSTYLTSYKEGLPLYDRNRQVALAEVRKLLKDKRGLLLFGNYTKGIGLRSLIEETRAFTL